MSLSDLGLFTKFGAMKKWELQGRTEREELTEGSNNLPGEENGSVEQNSKGNLCDSLHVTLTSGQFNPYIIDVDNIFY